MCPLGKEMETLKVRRKSRQKDLWQATWRVKDMISCMLLQAKSKWPSLSAVHMRGKKSSERPENLWARKISSCQWVSWDLTYRRQVWSPVLYVERALCIILPEANASCWKGGGEGGFGRWPILFFFFLREKRSWWNLRPGPQLLQWGEGDGAALASCSEGSAAQSLRAATLTEKDVCDEFVHSWLVL